MPANNDKEAQSRRHIPRQRPSTDQYANVTHAGADTDKYSTPRYDNAASYGITKRSLSPTDLQRSSSGVFPGQVSYGGSPLWSSQGMAPYGSTSLQPPMSTSSGQEQGSFGYAHVPKATGNSYQVGATCYARSSWRGSANDDLTRYQPAQQQQRDYNNVNFSEMGGHLRERPERSNKPKSRATSDPRIYGAATYEAPYTRSPEPAMQTMSDSMELQVGSPPQAISLENNSDGSRGSSPRNAGRQPQEYRSIASTTNRSQYSQMHSFATPSGKIYEGSQFRTSESGSGPHSTQMGADEHSQRRAGHYPPSASSYQPRERRHTVSTSFSKRTSFQEHNSPQQPPPGHADAYYSTADYRVGQPEFSQDSRQPVSRYSTAYTASSVGRSQQFHSTQQDDRAYLSKPAHGDPQHDDYQSYY